MKFEAINAVGVELEGGWVEKPRGMKGDGSVAGLYDVLSEGRRVSALGEVISRPNISWRGIETYIMRRYPDAVNKSCGLHVHVSFKRVADYSKLIQLPFEEWFCDAMLKWGKEARIENQQFFSRLRGENDFTTRTECESDITEQMRARSKGGPRYRVWNFCWSLHQTAECRVLPMFKDRTVACKAVRQVLSLVEAWCKKEDDGVIDFSTESEIESDTVVERTKTEIAPDADAVCKVKERVICV